MLLPSLLLWQAMLHRQQNGSYCDYSNCCCCSSHGCNSNLCCCCCDGDHSCYCCALKLLMSSPPSLSLAWRCRRQVLFPFHSIAPSHHALPTARELCYQLLVVIASSSSSSSAAWFPSLKAMLFIICCRCYLSSSLYHFGLFFFFFFIQDLLRLLPCILSFRLSSTASLSLSLKGSQSKRRRLNADQNLVKIKRET